MLSSYKAKQKNPKKLSRSRYFKMIRSETWILSHFRSHRQTVDILPHISIIPTIFTYFISKMKKQKYVSLSSKELMISTYTIDEIEVIRFHFNLFYKWINIPDICNLVGVEEINAKIFNHDASISYRLK